MLFKFLSSDFLLREIQYFIKILHNDTLLRDFKFRKEFHITRDYFFVL